jgi:hypothetical protein
MRAAYRRLKDKAKARGITFRLTFQAFRKFALQTEYLNRTGNGRFCLTIDRINNLKGYTSRNIQPLTRAANAIKQAKSDERRMAAGMVWKEKRKR